MLLLAIPLGLIVVMLIAALQGPPRFRPIGQSQHGGFIETAPPAPSGTPLPLPQQGDDCLLCRIVAIILAVVIGLAVLAMVTALLVLLIRRAIEAWRSRPLRTRAGADVDTEQPSAPMPQAEPDAVVIRRGIAEAIRVSAEAADPGDAIIAAWVGLEQTAADSGVARAASETPREFTLRIIARRAATARDVTALVDLYERVRFGGQTVGEDERRTARTLLGRLEEEWR